MKQLPKWLLYAFLTVAIIGFLDATFLTVKYYVGGSLPCALFHGCDIVTKSVYATIVGIPIALMGALYYLIQTILIILALDTGQSKYVKVAGYYSFVGFSASLYFLYLQIFILKALCIYCIFSALSSTLLFVLGLMILRHTRRTS